MSTPKRYGRDVIRCVRNTIDMREPANVLDAWFTYHPPFGDQPQRYGEIRDAARVFAVALIERCPPSAELTTALQHIRDAVFRANASIACNEKQGDA